MATRNFSTATIDWTAIATGVAVILAVVFITLWNHQTADDYLSGR